ncbi:hypothetical protein GCM10007973_11640 [Polymorphobacter multimanifer]|uniref:right-handed parallel beta-helix repeat-containing protein n=1 Tax=Polymorphobacter multimanifer TaxID=1070431 RepID=UPI001665CD8D|nr:right-handed parallel beta-helix repeat-containing protein [Polymorphobacter multimanifer]GGI76445.1 hypothetical protein GCM10007973_11640 [Polymorphobacter multimanifer]
MSSNRILTVSSSAEFTLALRAVRAGGVDTILVAPGSYGTLNISSVNPTGTLTIRPLDADAGATFSQMRLIRSSNITMEGFTLSNPIAPGQGRASAMQINKSSDIAISDFTVQGSLDGDVSNDAQGLNIIESSRGVVLNSAFQQVSTGITVGRASDVVIAGNSIIEAREGVNMSGVTNGLFERNYLADFQPMPGDHPDFFQIHAVGPAVGSSNMVFRDNVMIERGEVSIGGIFIKSENVAKGVRHENITIENNFYEGTYRNAIAVSNADGVKIESNTVLESQRVTHASAIIVDDVSRATVANNIAPMFIDTKRNGLLSDVVWENNIDVVDRRFGGQATAAELFDRNYGDMTNESMMVRAGSMADIQGAGARIEGAWGAPAAPTDMLLSRSGMLMGDLPALVHFV